MRVLSFRNPLNNRRVPIGTQSPIGLFLLEQRPPIPSPWGSRERYFTGSVKLPFCFYGSTLREGTS